MSWGFTVAAFVEFWIVAVICFVGVDIAVVEVHMEAIQHLVEIVL